MTTAYTPLLGFALPVEGELDGAWGDVVNQSITELVEDAIAATATQSVTAADWTLTTTGTGAVNQARCAILVPTGTPGVTRNIIAPSSSKAYIVDNQSNAAVVVKGSATVGTTIASGIKALVAWTGTDFVTVSSTAASGVSSVSGTGTVNGITLSGTVTSTGNLTLGGALSNVNLASQVTGTLPIANGGTGATTQQTALNALAGAVTSGQYLRGNGTNVLMSGIQVADVPTLNQNTTGTAANVTGIVAITNGGTGSTTASGARTALDVPSTTGGGASGTWSISVTGNAGTVTNGVVTTGSYADPSWITSLGGSKISGNISGNAANVTGTVAIANGGTGATTQSGARTALDVPSTTGSGASGTWGISVTGNAGTVTNGVVTTGSYADPSWITSLSGSKVSGNITGNAANVTGTVAVTNGGTGQTSYTDGQLLIGNTLTGGLTKATLTAGANITITNGNGTVTIASSSSGGTVTSVGLSAPTGFAVANSPVTGSGTLALSFAAGYSLPTNASQSAWDDAYADRLKWDGGGAGLSAATGRTSLGATTVGSNFFTLANPSAVTFPRINADNTVSALDAATFRAAIGAGTSSTTGTVTSVSGTGSVNGLTLTGTVTSTGLLTLGGALSGVDLTSQVTGTLPVANGGTGLTSITANRILYGGGSNNYLTSSNLQFDGTTLTVNTVSVGLGSGSVANNTAIGFGALNYNSSGSGIVAVGYRAGFQTSGVNDITVVGHNALSGNGTQGATVVGKSAAAFVTTAGRLTAIGYNAFFTKGSGDNCTAVGYNAGYNVQTGAGSTFIGDAAGYQADGNNNTAVGWRALSSLPSTVQGACSNNSVVGTNSFARATSSTNNCGLGVDSGAFTTQGDDNIAIGYTALYSNTTASKRVAIGTASQYGSDSETSQSTSVGYQSLYIPNATTANASESVAFGAYALAAYTASTGTFTKNVAIGTGAMALSGITTGSVYESVAVGYQALTSNTNTTSSIFGNVGVGHQAGLVVNSNYNTLIGYKAGYTTVTGGGNNVVIGALAEISGGGGANQIVVGYNLTGKGDNTAFIGGTAGAYNAANVTTWSTTSDERIKKNFKSVTNGLEVINALEPEEFDYILDGKHDVGFRAQKYQTVLPDQVRLRDASPEEQELIGDSNIYAIQRNLDPYFVSAIKALTEEVNRLKAELAELKGR